MTPDHEDELERLEEMKLLWGELRAQGIPIEQRPLAADLPWSLQFQAQTDADPNGPEMAWWETNKQKFHDVE